MEKRTYLPSDIIVLDGLEHIRQRPGMYVGHLDSSGLHQLVTIVLDNVMDEALEGHCSRASLTLWPDGSISIEDDGRGISVAPKENSDKTILEVVFTSLHACYCGCGQGPGHRRSISGLGVCVVNALSEWLVVETSSDGLQFRMRFERGKRVGELESLGPAGIRGTRVHFLPDRSIFQRDAHLDYAHLCEELHGLAALSPGLALELVENGTSTVFQCPHGLSDLVRSLAECPRLVQPIEASRSVSWPEDESSFKLQVAIQFEGPARRRLVGFANFSRVDAGTHVQGFTEGLSRGLCLAAAGFGLSRDPGWIPDGLLAAIAVELPRPMFRGGYRGELSLDSPVASHVAEAVASVVEGWAKDHATEVRALLVG